LWILRGVTDAQHGRVTDVVNDCPPEIENGQAEARKWGQKDTAWIFLTPSFCPFLRDDD
jgi:hypothetical protein